MPFLLLLLLLLPLLVLLPLGRAAADGGEPRAPLRATLDDGLDAVAARPAGFWAWDLHGGDPAAPIALDVHPTGEIWMIEARHRRLLRLTPQGERVGYAAEAGGERLPALASRLFARSGLHVFALDAWNRWVDRYDLRGHWEQRFDLSAAAEAGGELLGSVADFCLRRSGELIVLDAERARLLLFRSDGELERVMGDAETEGLRRPVDLDIDGRGRLHLLETDPPAILTIDLDDRFRRRPLPLAPPAARTATPCLAVDVWGNAFVGDPVQGAVWIVPAGGGPPWAVTHGEAQMDPTALALDDRRRLLVADATQARVWLFVLTYRVPVPGAQGGARPR